MDEDKKQEEKTEEKNPQSREGEYLNNWKRERADFINYKKEESRRLAEFAKFANEDVILEVLEIVEIFFI